MSTFAKPVRSVAPVRVEAPATEPIAKTLPREAGTESRPAIRLGTRYAWPKLEGLPAGVDWEIVRPGDPNYEVWPISWPPSSHQRRRAEAVPSTRRPTPAAEPVTVEPSTGAEIRGRERLGVAHDEAPIQLAHLEGIECVDLLAEVEPDETGLYTITDPEPPKPKPKPSLLRPERSVRTRRWHRRGKASPTGGARWSRRLREWNRRQAGRSYSVCRERPRHQPFPRRKTVTAVAQPPAAAQSVAPAAKPAAPVRRQQSRHAARRHRPAFGRQRAVAPAAPAPRTAAPAVGPARTGARIESAVKPAATPGRRHWPVQSPGLCKAQRSSRLTAPAPSAGLHPRQPLHRPRRSGSRS